MEKNIRILTDEPEINPIHRFGLYSDTIVNMIMSSDPKFSIGINGDWGTGKTTLMKLVQMKLAKQDKTLRYLFNWNTVLENDNDILALKNFLRQKFSLSYVEDLKLERPNGNVMAVHNTKDLSSTSIVLDEESSASLLVDGIKKSDELIARRDNNDLNIYVKNKILTVWFNAWRYEREDQYSLIALMKTIGYAMGKDDSYKKIKPILLRGLGIIGKDILRNLALRYVMTNKGIEELDNKLLPKMDFSQK